MLISFATEINSVYPSFNVKQFEKTLFGNNPKWDKKPDSVKLALITSTLNKMINVPYLEQLDVFLKVSDQAEYRWVNMVMPHFVQIYGLDHFEESMYALKEFTKKCSSEFGIRPFVNKYPEESAFLMYQWAADEHFRVRRLASEGSRPYLPGGPSVQAFVQNPFPIIPILDRLKQDTYLYVKKSVSNSMNDISKKHPELILKMCREWKELNDVHTNYIIHRACRTLLKKGNTDALDIIQQVTEGPHQVTNLRLQSTAIEKGDTIQFSFKIENPLVKNGKGKQESSEMEEEEVEDNLSSYKYKKAQKNSKKEVSMDIEETQQDKNAPIKIEICIHSLDDQEEYVQKVFPFIDNYLMNSITESFSGKISTKDFITKKTRPGDNYLAVLINGNQKYKTYYQFKMKM